MPRSRTLALALVSCGVLTGCDPVRDALRELGIGADEAPSTPPVTETETETPPPADPDADVPPPAIATLADAEPVPVERAPGKHPFLAKGSNNMGFRLDGLSELHALAGVVTVPAWAEPSPDDPALVRDDDLATAWTCTPGKEHRCALGLSFRGTANVSAVRLFAANGPGLKAGQGARPKRLRLHTESGYLDVNLPDQRDFVYAILGGPIDTHTLGLEVLETRPEGAPIRIAELEVYGRGPTREPLELDPATAFVAYEDAPWVRRGEGYEARESWVKTIAADGSIRTLAPGSALRGYVGDRLVLLERLVDASCREGRGTFFLLDRTTRMVAPLGELAGVGADLFRRPDGLGLGLGYTDAYTTTLHGIALEAGRYVRKHTPVREDKRTNDTFGEWGLDAAVVRRGGASLGDAPIGCRTATEDMLAELEAALARKKPSARVPAQWQVCELGQARLLASDRGGCGDGWELHLLARDGKLVASTIERTAQAFLRLVRLSSAAMLVEATGSDDRGVVLRVTPEGIEVLAPHGALVTPPPSRCRTPCSASFPNPLAPAFK